MRSNDSKYWWKAETDGKRSHSVEGVCIDFRGNKREDKVRYSETLVNYPAARLRNHRRVQ